MAASIRLTLLSKNISSLSCRQPNTLTNYGGSIICRSLCLHYPAQSSKSSPSVPKTQLLQSAEPFKSFNRCTSFFAKLPAEQLWKGVTSVSNAGKKRGRGKGIGKKMSKDLNRGQIIGIGQENIVWPGLNAPIIRGKELVHQQHLPKDEEREAKLLKLRDNMGVFRPLRLAPQDRGWTGSKMPGRSIGPPDPIGEDTFEDFDTKVLELKTVTNMSGIFGRKRRISVFAVAGNGNGLAGFALAKANSLPAALRKARNMAGQKLMYLERYNDHTVFHDFHSQFVHTKLFVKKMPEGHGLVCHRAIKTICEIIGIKDLYAKVEGTTNIQNLTKAFFIGLLNQKTHHQLADEKQLHLVEFREETRNFPNVVASPSSVVRSESEIPPDEELDYRLYTMGGKVELMRQKFPPFYHSRRGYELYLKKYQTYRNRENVIRSMLSEQGEVKSFLADQYPECVMGGLRPPFRHVRTTHPVIMADEKKKKKKKKEEDTGANEPPAPPPSKAPSRKSASSSKKAKKGGPGSSVFEMFSQRQVAEFKEGFQMMDKDKDGVIGAKDLMDTYDELGKVVTEKECEDMLGDAPAPINFTMLLTMFGERQSGGSDDDEVVVEALRAFEGEGGLIDGKNLRNALTTWGDKFTDKEVDDAYEQMEADEDENISCDFVIEMLTGKGKEDEAAPPTAEAAA